MTIRPITTQDLPQLLAIEKDATAFPWTEKAHADGIEEKYPSLLIEVEDEVVGFIIFNFYADECHLLNVVVAKSRQNQGIASKLFQALLKACESKPISSVILEVRASNTVAINWYQSLNFEQIGVRKSYYRGNLTEDLSREDAIVMKKAL